MLSKIGMAAAVALICSAAHAETVAPSKLMQLAQAKPAAACTMIYLPVCGEVKGKPTNFGNDCEAQLAKAKNIKPGRCLPKG
jgi:CTP:molybdopterin cytidylyltransferase MocA